MEGAAGPGRQVWLGVHTACSGAVVHGCGGVQAEVPFDRDTVEYIMRLDAGSELVMLAEHGVHVRPACARIFKAATMVLKKVAARGLSPRAAADILERNTLRKSTMEKMHR